MGILNTFFHALPNLDNLASFVADNHILVRRVLGYLEKNHIFLFYMFLVLITALLIRLGIKKYFLLQKINSDRERDNEH